MLTLTGSYSNKELITDVSFSRPAMVVRMVQARMFEQAAKAGKPITDTVNVWEVSEADRKEIRRRLEALGFHADFQQMTDYAGGFLLSVTPQVHLTEPEVKANPNPNLFGETINEQ